MDISNNLLTTAIAAHDVEGVRQALARGADPNARREMAVGEKTFQPTTPLRQVLFHAGQSQSIEVCQAFVGVAQMLLDAGADPEDAIHVSLQFAKIHPAWDGDEAKAAVPTLVMPVCGVIARAAAEQRRKTAKEKKFHGATFSNISRAVPVSFYGSVHRRYNVWSDVCCWAVLSIEDYPVDMPNPITREPCKGEAFGLTCWQVLAMCSGDIGNMSVVTLNGVHPSISDDEDESLCYQPDEYDLTTFAARVDKTAWPMTEQLALFFARPDNLLRTWLFQAHPTCEIALEAEPKRLVHMACRGVVSGKQFPSNIITLMHLPVMQEGPYAQDQLPAEVHGWSRNYDMTSMPIALQVVLATCARYTMIPTQLLLEVNLILSYTLVDEGACCVSLDSPRTTYEVSVKVPFRDSFYSGFREVGGDATLYVRAL
jgi:hypothetical protein